MNLLGSLFSNDTIKNAAFSGLRKMMVEEGLSAIVLRSNPGNEKSVIPGFDVDMFRAPIVIFEEGTVGISEEQWKDYSTLVAMRATVVEHCKLYNGLAPEHAEAFSDPEVKEMINRYLKAKKLTNGTDSTAIDSDPDQYTTTPDLP